MKHSCLRWLAAAIVATTADLSGTSAHADTVDGLVEFTAGSTARADEVNGNFSAVANAVNDNDARIAALEEEIAALREQLSNVLNVNEYLSLETVNDQPTVRLTGANLQIVNGMGRTATSNGTGNLLIGYDERRGEGRAPGCSLGTNPDNGSPVTNETECAAAGGIFAVNHTGGSHYLVVGPEHNYSRWGGIVVGNRNTSSFDFASVSGGTGNTANAILASVSGGSGNVASGQISSVSGGQSNVASGRLSSVSGGNVNVASGRLSRVSGGRDNIASGLLSSVSGGRDNDAVGTSSSVSGGRDNNAVGAWSSVSGGRFNNAGGESSSVSGGFNRGALDPSNWAAGSLFEDE
jgi:hypothetical protein